MPSKYEMSRRDCRGGGIKWHGKGYRERGELYIQFKRDFFYPPFSRYHAVNENSTMGELYRTLERDLSMDDGYPLPRGLFFEFQAFRGKRLDDSDDPVGEWFDGGETVHVKVFDEHDRQWLFNGRGWQLR